MIITTTDPITGEDIRNPEFKPFVIEGSGHLAIKIHFESEETRRQYLDIAGGEFINGSNQSTTTRPRNPGNPSDHSDLTIRLLHPLDAEDRRLYGRLL